MAYLDKEAYEGKREWAARKNDQQKQVKTLTEEQHDALTEICRIRHEIHCDQEDLFVTGSSNYEAFWANFPSDLGEGRMISFFPMR